MLPGCRIDLSVCCFRLHIRRFVCPITGSLCEQVPFSALATCGHVFSDRAIRQVRTISSELLLPTTSLVTPVLSMQHFSGFLGSAKGSCEALHRHL